MASNDVHLVLDEHQIEEVSGVLRIQGPLVLVVVGCQDLEGVCEGFFDHGEPGEFVQAGPLGHRRMGKSGCHGRQWRDVANDLVHFGHDLLGKAKGQDWQVGKLVASALLRQASVCLRC